MSRFRHMLARRLKGIGLTLASLTLGVSLAACGGSDPVKSATSCWSKKGLAYKEGKKDSTGTVRVDVDTFANHAEVTIAPSDLIEDIAIGQEPRAALNGVELRKHKNATVLWDQQPTDDEAARIEGCLGGN